MPIPTDLQHLAQNHADDLARMRLTLAAAGKYAEDDDIILAWVTYSDRLCAGWMALPEDDGVLVATLLKYLPTRWIVAMSDTEGSSGGVLFLPEKLLTQMEWGNGDIVIASANATGELVLRRIVVNAYD